MLGQPVTVITEPLGVPGELQRRRDRLRGGVSGNDRRLVED
jgi:hypothetical protein